MLVGGGVAEDTGVPWRLFGGEDHGEMLVLAAAEDVVDARGDVSVGEDTAADFSCRFCGVVREALPVASSTRKVASCRLIESPEDGVVPVGTPWPRASDDGGVDAEVVRSTAAEGEPNTVFVGPCWDGRSDMMIR